MGGSGSGSWYRWNAKPVVEDGLTLDLARLIRQGLLVQGRHVSGSIRWSRVSDGAETASIGYEADLTKPHSAFIRLRYNHNDKPQDYKIRITTTEPNFGGVRWWFICPVSGQRVGKLYSPPGQALFASRKVFNLAYRSQNETPMFRHLTIAQDIRRRLGGSLCTDDSFPYKPKGMHWKTYWKLRDKAEWATNRSNIEAIKYFGLTPSDVALL